ncbi:MAG: HAD family hydrolase [Verrucomicrobia bacterium]|nr:HAD family hydrolase [Verrucomicrobiota bacterium]
MTEAVVFDLDGTLLNTIDDLADSMNAALHRMGHAGHAVDVYKGYVGDGVRALVERALPEDAADEVSSCMDLMREEYASRWSTKTQPYDGVPELLDVLRGRGVRLAVLSNKPHRYTLLNIEQYFDPGTFEIVFGERDGVPRKPDPAGALEIASAFGIAPREILYVGDTDTDMQTAVAAEMIPVGVLWGFRSKDELIAHGARFVCSDPSDVVSMLD